MTFTLLSNYFSEFVVQILGSVLVIALVMVVILLQDWRVAAVFGGFVVVVMGFAAEPAPHRRGTVAADPAGER